MAGTLIRKASVALCAACISCAHGWETVAPEPAPAAPHVAPAAPQKEIGSIPLVRGDIPDGWTSDGLVGIAVQFSRAEIDAAVQFVIFTTEGNTAPMIVRRASEDMAKKAGVVVADIDERSETEASLRFTDSRIGEKRGRLVARTFPEKTNVGILVVGLWRAEDDAEGNGAFETLLAWVRAE